MNRKLEGQVALVTAGGSGGVPRFLAGLFITGHPLLVDDGFVTS